MLRHGDMRQDVRYPVLTVRRDDGQVVPKIHVELVHAVPERLNQCMIARVKLGLIEAKYEWAIVGREKAKASPET
jgi:hypothetical protein